MYVVSSHDDVDRGMKFDTCDLGSADFHHVIDVMDMVILDDREYASHTPDDTCLFTVMDMAAADDMRADIFLEPSVILAAADGITLHLCRALHTVLGEIVVVLGIEVLSERNTAATAVGNFAILDDPAAAPVRADHTILECRRRRPCGSCLVHGKSGKSDISDTGLTREEAVSSDVDLDLGLIRIFALEVGVDYGLSVFLLTVPLTCGVFRFPGSGILLAL